MRLVIVESPYAGDVARNERYARAALADCLRRGEAPLASHLLYTQPGVLDDRNPAERTLGIEAGLAWGVKAEATVVYTDCGVSEGMKLGIARAEAEGRSVELRSLADTSVLRDKMPAGLDPAKRPKMRPSISTVYGLHMGFVDGDGKRHVLDLCEHDLWHLGLSIAGALEQIAKKRVSRNAA